ncbi:hypothetical protein AXK11_01265 [Cephaloticoccus primus]|uniref:Uncharacterized protein n=1 Tax=Cephaloticoccus primus TaxID=1548207 RepID=A0A139SU39_9BACT|nr:hypothetical protein [Cephaloticoccus primus]KXU38096.1 hypothetical protein AXK11_01265 [Cephaloticoccus primus]
MSFGYRSRRDGIRHLFLDNLIFEGDSHLLVTGWKSGLHRLFVRKDSWFLDDILENIEFEGTHLPKGSLRSYDNTYWEIIPGLPEPATYGEIFSAIGLGLWYWGKKQRRRYIAQQRVPSVA